MVTMPTNQTAGFAGPDEVNSEAVRPWLTPDEAARLLNVSACTLRRLAKHGEIPCRMVGTRYRFRYEDLRDWPGSAPRAAIARRRWDDDAWREEIAHLNPYRAS